MIRSLFSALLFAWLGLASVVAAPTEPADKPEGPKKEAPKTDYILQPSDLLKVQVFQEEDLNREVRISQENTVTLPLIGSIDLPHGLARVVLAEQLYRAVSILGNHPYHRE